MSDDEPTSFEELVFDVGEFMEDLVAHGVAGVDRTTSPPTYWLKPDDEMSPDARVYWEQFGSKA